MINYMVILNTLNGFKSLPRVLEGYLPDDSVIIVLHNELRRFLPHNDKVFNF